MTCTVMIFRHSAISLQVLPCLDNVCQELLCSSTHGHCGLLVAFFFSIPRGSEKAPAQGRPFMKYAHPLFDGLLTFAAYRALSLRVEIIRFVGILSRLIPWHGDETFSLQPKVVCPNDGGGRQEPDPFVIYPREI